LRSIDVLGYTGIGCAVLACSSDGRLLFAVAYLSPFLTKEWWNVCYQNKVRYCHFSRAMLCFTTWQTTSF